MKKKDTTPVDVDDSFLKEIDKEVKNDHMKDLWQKYGLAVVLGVAVILAVTVSFETIKAWSHRSNQELSNAYAVAVSMQSQGRYEESLKILQKMADSNKGIYSEIAKIQVANVLFEEGKNAEAAALLEEIINDRGVSRQMKDISTIKLASYKLDTNTPREEITAMLMPLTAEDNSWSNVAHEMLAMLAIRESDISGAKAEYQAIIDSSDVQDTLKNRAQEMLSILNDDNK